MIVRVADLAAKEHAIKLMMERAYDDFYSMRLEFLALKESDAFVLSGLEAALEAFEDMHARMCTLETNPYAEYYAPTIKTIALDVKSAIDFFTTWREFQNHWVYMNPVFAQEDMRENLPEEAQNFDRIDAIFRLEIATAR